MRKGRTRRSLTRVRRWKALPTLIVTGLYMHAQDPCRSHFALNRVNMRTAVIAYLRVVCFVLFESAICARSPPQFRLAVSAEL